MSQMKAFSIAELLASHNLPCKLWRTSDGVWHVKACGDNVKWNELFGDVK